MSKLRSIGLMNEHRSSESDLEPPFLLNKEVPPEVATAREQEIRNANANREIFESRIERHLEVHRNGLEHLHDTHQWIADHYDFDLAGDTRYAAAWQMAGRCLGIAYLMVDALKLGYTGEVVHLARSLHEADRLLDAFVMPGEDALLRQWLRGGHVSPSDARKAEERFDKFLNEKMKEAGYEPTVENRAELSRTMYGKLSPPAHHDRESTEEAVAPGLRMMIVGECGAWVRRAETVEALLLFVEEALLSVGDALSKFMGPNWWEEHVIPFRNLFAELRAVEPLA